jgi:lactoylglutathione lyase
MKLCKMLCAATAAACSFVIGANAQTAPPPKEGHSPPKALSLMSAAVPASDLERSIEFYTKGLGLTVAGKIENPRVTEVPLSFPGGGSQLMLVKPKPAEADLRSRDTHIRVVLSVPDLEALVARLAAAGYPLKNPVRELPQYRVAVGIVEDPDANVVELVQLKR